MSLSSVSAFLRPNGMIQFMPPATQFQPTRGPIPETELKQLASVTHAGPVTGPATGAMPADGSFGNVLSKMVQEVNAKQVSAAESVNGLLSGQQVNLHEAMIAMEEASVSFQLMVEVRNKLLESYQELMRMQI